MKIKQICIYILIGEGVALLFLTLLTLFIWYLRRRRRIRRRQFRQQRRQRLLEAKRRKKQQEEIKRKKKEKRMKRSSRKKASIRPLPSPAHWRPMQMRKMASTPIRKTITDTDKSKSTDEVQKSVKKPTTLKKSKKIRLSKSQATKTAKEKALTAKERKAKVIIPTKSTVRTSESSTTSSSGTDSADITTSLTATTSKTTAVSMKSTERKTTATARPNHEDFDAIYENTEEQKQQHHRALFLHLISQLRIGMDLTKITLPTTVLERRSLLEMYADFFVHPDDLILASTISSPQNRFFAVLRYYLNSFLPARRTEAKKPYNPVLGEVFRCRWTVPGTTPSKEKTKFGPFPGSGINQATFISEQVSHHPPVSAFYAEHPEAGVSFNGQIYTKSQFKGLSIAVYNIGSGILTLQKHNEHYEVNFPNAYARSILTTPWIELGGKVIIKCVETGYCAIIEFMTKGMFGGKPHQIKGLIYKSSPNKILMRLKGDWKSLIYTREEGAHVNRYELFTNVLEKKDVRKECVPVMLQEDYESRKMWRYVTASLFNNDIRAATRAKKLVEDRQRDEMDQRSKDGVQWRPKFFKKEDERWTYKESLPNRSSF